MAKRWAILTMVVGLGLALAGPAGAQSYTGGNVPNVGRVDRGPVVVTPLVSGAQVVQPARLSGTSAGTATTQGFAPVRLAFTGADVVGLAVIGLLLVGLGAAAMRSSRRRSPA